LADKIVARIVEELFGVAGIVAGGKATVQGVVAAAGDKNLGRAAQIGVIRLRDTQHVVSSVIGVGNRVDLRIGDGGKAASGVVSVLRRMAIVVGDAEAISIGSISVAGGGDALAGG